MLEKTKWEDKNGQARDTDSIVYKTQIKDKAKNTTQETKKISNTEPTQKQTGWTQVLRNGQQFLFLIRHLQCYL